MNHYKGSWSQNDLVEKKIEEPEERSNGGKLNKGVHMELTKLDRVLC